MVEPLKISIPWQLARRFLGDDWTDELVEELTLIMADAAMKQGMEAFMVSRAAEAEDK